MRRFLFVIMMALASTSLFAEDKPVANPVWMMVVHDVEDYDTWRTIFDGGLSTRKSGGELQFEINRFPDDPNKIVSIFQWDTAAGARAFVDDRTVRNAMIAAGVISDPMVTIRKEKPRFDGG